jgi:Flp pilus assembly protein TadD
VILGALFVVGAGCAAYSDSFQGPFVFDDEPSIAKNPAIERLWPLWPVLASRQTATVIGRPLLNLSLAVSYAFHGTDVRGYHAFSLVTHLLCGVLLFALIRETWIQTRPAEQRMATWFAGAAALLWTVHPLNTAAVLYIVQRAELMCGLFYLGSLYGLLHLATSSRTIFWGTVTIASCLLAILCKEVAATLPVVALLYDRTFLAGSFREALRLRWKTYVGLFATWLVLGALMLYSEGRRETATTDSFVRPIDYALTQFGVIVTYLKLCVWPHPLVFDYGVFFAKTSGEIVPYAILIGVLLLAAGVALVKWPKVGFLALAPFVILGPTSTVVPLVTHTATEHRMYLPLMAIVVLATLAINALRELIMGDSRASGSRSFLGSPTNLFFAGIVAAIATTFGILTFQRAADFRSNVKLWRDTAQKRPQNSRAFYNLGVKLLQEGRTTEAQQAFDGAIAAAARYDDPYHRNMLSAGYNVRAGVLANSGDVTGALRDHDAALAIQKRADFLCHRAQTLAKAGKLPQALADFQSAVELDPDSAEAYSGRATTYLQLGDYDRAWKDVLEARRRGGDISAAALQQLQQRSGRNP